jgi:hypothetical protein
MSENDNSIVAKIIEPLKSKTSGILSWIYSPEGNIITKTIAGLSSYVVGDPTGMVFSTILECADYGIRKRVLKHFPDLVEKLDREKIDLNMTFIKSELGQQLLRDTIKAFTKETEDRKIEKLKDFLISTYRQQNPDEAFTRASSKRLLEMDSIHMQILSAFNNPENTLRSICSQKKPDGQTIKLEIAKDLNPYFLKMDDSIFSSALKELENWGILDKVVNTQSFGGCRIDNIELGIRSNSQMLRDKITDFGKRFIELVGNL